MPMDVIDYGVQSQEYIIIPVAHNTIAQGRKSIRPHHIVPSPFRVLTAIQFDNQPGLRTDEVGNVAANGDLSAKAETL